MIVGRNDISRFSFRNGNFSGAMVLSTRKVETIFHTVWIDSSSRFLPEDDDDKDDKDEEKKEEASEETRKRKGDPDKISR